MQRRSYYWYLVGLFGLCGAIFLFRPAEKQKDGSTPPAGHSTTPALKSSPGATPNASANLAPKAASKPGGKTVPPANRAGARRPRFQLANTTNTLDRLIHNEKAIILANALIDTSLPIDLAIPKGLRAPANNGTYVVQANGPIDDHFRAALQNANAAIISSIPNNAYLVRVSDAGAAQLSSNPQMQSILPFEPYYKLDPTLLQSAIEQTPLPPNTAVSVTVFPDARETTLAALKQLGADVVAEDRSPFGPVFEIHPAANTLDQVASLPGVHVMGMLRARVPANDLLRPAIGVALDSVTATNWLGLTGSNVVVEINDTGVDSTHPDLTGRVLGDFSGSLVDNVGHGTHVAGTILGNGSKSSTVTNAIGSLTNANFRGIATNATAFSVSIIDAPLGQYYNQTIEIGGTLGRGVLTAAADSYLQEEPALTNALISNNSWSYAGSRLYDIAAASYDAAVRDALPGVPGSQPVLFVFSSGDTGGGNSDGTGGSYDSISSPGTAKNVITVGAIEQPRGITNDVVIDGNTNALFFPDSDSGDEVAEFSGRGAVGVGIEGPFGRFKPDVVAPGTMVISDASTTWDTNAYYNITNYNYYYYFNLTADSSNLASIVFPEQNNPVGLIITVLPNKSSPQPFPTKIPIYGVLNDTPTTNNFLGNNQVILPTGGIPLNPGDTIFFSIGDGTNQAMNFDVQIEYITTNDVGNYEIILAQLNSGVGPWYRYESGTSMAAAGVSGMLACMQEFFEGRQITNSPALMKALVINGARSVSQIYDMSLASGVLPQGWGLVNLSNTIPSQLTALTPAGISPANATTLPLLYVDQSPANALATGQSQTYAVNISSNAATQPLRITLVWTDPPGDPVAGTKLVNNLVLIVTNTETGQVFLGNDIPSGSTYNEPWDTTNGPPNIDLVNNVQNVYLSPPPGSNYTVTVLAERVNVNAITSNTNGVVQDYALVISSGDSGAVPTPFTLFTPGPVITAPTLNPVLTNIAAVPAILTNGMPLFNQRVGANPSTANNTLGIGSGFTLTRGLTNQWNFYVYTNTAALTNGNYTNVAFITFFPPGLATPGVEANQEVDPNSTNATRFFGGADIDLYVTTDSSLTNLNSTALINAQKSLNQGGNEVITYTNSTAGQVFYIGVKSEDQQGGQFDLVGLASDLPFSQKNTNGDVTVYLMPVPAPIPPGSPTVPGTNFLFGIVTQPVQIRKVVVTNTVTAQDFGDYVGTLIYGQAFVVLNNHSFFTNANDAAETFFYDDMGDNQFPTAKHSDGPGSLQSFVGKDGLKSGAWIFSMVNDSSSDSGQIDSLSLLIEHQPPPTNGFYATIPANGWYYGFVDVPALATNMIFYVSQITPPETVDLYVRRGTFPTSQIYDEFEPIQPGLTNALSISEFDDPPLSPVRYFFGLYNPNPQPVQVYVIVDIQLNLSPTPQAWLVSTNTPSVILDDAVSYSTINVPVKEAIAGVQAGVRIVHSRESDLALTLISPAGTRVLLAENRGGLDTNGYGSGVNITNFYPQTASGGIAAATNSIGITNTGGTLLTSGTLIINYQFYTVPDDMRVFYGGVLIFDSGLVNGGGTYYVNFGPGSATNLTIIMNEPGSNPNSSGTSGDEWNYTVTAIESEVTYAIFTDDTNSAFLPIKFAEPPFGAGSGSSIVNFSDFENNGAGNYFKPATVDGWSVISNDVTVVSAPPPANNGTNFLGLRDGSIKQTLTTIAGTPYNLQFFESRAVPLDPVHWWPGNSSPRDIMGVDPQDGLWYPLGSDSYTSGEVGAAFNFDPATNNYVKVAANPTLDVGLAAGFTLDCWVNPARYSEEPLIEWYDSTGARLGVNLWLLTNSPNSQSLFANIIDSTGKDHVLNSPRGSITPGVFQYVALTYNITNGAALYINGVAVATNLTFTNFIPQTSAAFDLYFGRDISAGYRFAGQIDEVGLYNQTLTAAQILDLYQVHGLGRCGTLNPPSVCPAPMANVLIGGMNVGLVIASSTNWTPVPINFTAGAGTGTTVEIDYSNNTSGVQLDTFTLAVRGQNNYFLPEEPLAKLLGENALGTWTLEIVDSRAGATNPTPELASWELNFTYNTTTPSAFPLVDAVARTNFVPPNGVLYFSVAVPAWAQFATNTLFNVTGGAVSLIFNQNYLPGINGANNFGDVPLLVNVTSSGTDVLSNTVPATPILVPDATYLLAVTNLSPNIVSFAIDVSFNIISLTNGVPFTNTIAPNGIPQYYSYTVTNATPVAVAFQILQPTGNLELVARHAPPLPDLTDFDYISDNPGVANQSIVVVTNSTPVALAPGTWYLAVVSSSTNAVAYTIEATEVDGPSEPLFITLTNLIPYTFTNGVPPGAPPGVALTTFFVFNISNSPPSALFELYNLSNNLDLTLQFMHPPYTTPFFAGSFSPGTNNEQIVIRTNVLGTNINGAWYLGVPNNAATNVPYTIRASLPNPSGLLISEFPLDLSVAVSAGNNTNRTTLRWQSVNGETYEILSTTNLVPPIVWVTNVVVATGQNTTYTDTNSIYGSIGKYYEIIQVPAGP